MKSPRRFMAKYGVNIAGFLYNIGNVAQLASGTIEWSAREIVSSVLLILSSTSFNVAGHKRWGVPLGCGLAIIGVFLAAWPGIANGETGTIFGFMALVVSASFGLFGAPLARNYGKARKRLLRETLGQPRRMMGLTALFLCRMPIIIEDILHERWASAVFFTIWALGDLAASMAKVP